MITICLTFLCWIPPQKLMGQQRLPGAGLIHMLIAREETTVSPSIIDIVRVITAMAE